METRQNNLTSVEEEEEEGVTLQGRQSKHLTHNGNNATSVVESGYGDDNGNGHGGAISRSSSSTISSDVDQLNASNETTNLTTEKDEEEGNRVHSGVYLDQENGARSVDVVSDMKVNGSSGSVPEIDANNTGMLSENSDSQNNLTKEINHQSRKILDNEAVSSSSLTLLQVPNNEQSDKSEPSNLAATSVEGFEIIEEIDVEGTDYDVEKVLDKQNTHDLYCPNCHSCITTKVILRRKRRKLRTARPKSKSARVEVNTDLEKAAHPDNDQHYETGDIVSDDHQRPEIDDHNAEREPDPDVFRCLSCLSFFIPIGNGKLFPPFRNNARNENVQDTETVSASNTNWFLSIFRSDKKKRTSEQAPNSGEQGSNQNMSTPLSNNVISRQLGDNSQVPLPISDNLIGRTGHPAEGLVNDVGSAAHEEGKAIINSSTNEHQHFEGAVINAGIASKDTTGKVNTENASSRPQQGGVNSMLSSTHNTIRMEQSDGKTDKIVGTAIENVKIVQNASVPSLVHFQGGSLLDDALNKKPLLDNTGKDVILTIEREPQETAVSDSQRVQNVDGSVADRGVPISGTTTNTLVGAQRGAGISEARDWEILKSIVYGGLIESITSLGVVSSAAGAGTATLNVLALGLANLFGGLFIMGHNLADLKNDHHGGSSSEPNEQVEDRYAKTLGRRENFPLHATVAILSFLIFGLIPPVIYGFSFRKSDNRDLKLAAVGGASLVCVMLLAIGKAHVRRQARNYVGTVLYYASIAVMASGASYIAGDLLNMLWEKLGWSDSQPSSSVSLSFPTAKPVNPAWASY